MKRIASISLLLLMLVAAVQPTLALHFCGGSLHSVNLLNGAGKSCCKGEMQSEQQPSNGISFSQNCCSNQTIELATDVFQTSQQELNIDAQTFSFVPFPVLSNNDRNANEPEYILVFQQKFPPGGLAKTHADMLSLVCSFLI
jgi:hypothetical protein